MASFQSEAEAFSGMSGMAYKIVSETELLLSNKETYLAMSMAENPYGDGRATSRIVNLLA